VPIVTVAAPPMNCIRRFLQHRFALKQPLMDAVRSMGIPTVGLLTRIEVPERIRLLGLLIEMTIHIGCTTGRKSTV